MVEEDTLDEKDDDDLQSVDSDDVSQGTFSKLPLGDPSNLDISTHTGFLLVQTELLGSHNISLLYHISRVCPECFAKVPEISHAQINILEGPSDSITYFNLACYSSSSSGVELAFVTCLQDVPQKSPPYPIGPVIERYTDKSASWSRFLCAGTWWLRDCRRSCIGRRIWEKVQGLCIVWTAFDRALADMHMWKSKPCRLPSSSLSWGIGFSIQENKAQQPGSKLKFSVAKQAVSWNYICPWGLGMFIKISILANTAHSLCVLTPWHNCGLSTEAPLSVW